MKVEGLITLPSVHSVAATIVRARGAMASRGMTVFAHIDHAAGARAVGLSLRPTEVLIFGNALAGTPLMQASQSIAIDLPLRFLVCEDEAGATLLSFYSAEYLARRHGIETDAAAKMTLQIMQLAQEVAADK